MRKALLFTISCLLYLLAACSRPDAERMTLTATISPTPTEIPTRQVAKPTAVPFMDTPYPSPLPDEPYPVPVRPVASIIPSPTSTLSPSPLAAEPYPGPLIPTGYVPSVTPTPSPSPSLTFTPIRPTPTFPSSLESLRIAYTAKGKLWLWHLGVSTPLTDIGSTTYRVRISDDGQVVAFTRGGSGLWAINSDGTNERLLISTNDFKAIEPTDPGVFLSELNWIPNTHILLFNTRLNTDIGISMTDDLHLVDVDTNYRAALLPPGKGGNFFPSPDGNLLAIVTPTEIRLMGVDGSNYHRALLYPRVAIGSEFEYYASPVWASDSQSLMVAIPPGDVYYDTNLPTTIWHLPITEEPAVDISYIEAERGQYVYLSPDFTKIAILKVINLRPPEYTTELHLAEIDGLHDELYPGCNSLFIGWVQDSEHFVCQSGRSYMLGQSGYEPIFLAKSGNQFEWLSSSNFLYLYGYAGLDEIRLGSIGEPDIILVGPEDGPVYYDFSK